MDARHGDVVAPREHARDLLGVVAFVHEVELAGDIRGELVDERHQVEVALHEIDRAEQHAQVREVAAHETLDLGILHLHRHALAALQARFVHLGERGRCDRLALDRREDVLEGAVELALERLLHHGERLGGHAILQLREHLDVFAREHVGARARGTDSP